MLVMTNMLKLSVIPVTFASKTTSIAPNTSNSTARHAQHDFELVLMLLMILMMLLMLLIMKKNMMVI